METPTKIQTLLTDPKNLNKLLYNKYGDITEDFAFMNLDALIYSKNCHLFSKYKDLLIWDYLEEFLKKYYSRKQSNERIVKLANYYRNYLKFFCTPFFRDFKKTDILQNYGDCKAQIYYKTNYGDKKEKEENIKLNESDDIEELNEIMLFNNSIRKNIDAHILTATAENLNTLCGLDENLLMKTDLLTRREGEKSLLNILNNMGEDGISDISKKINDRFKNKLNKPYNKPNNKPQNFSTTDRTNKTKTQELSNIKRKKESPIRRNEDLETKNIKTSRANPLISNKSNFNNHKISPVKINKDSAEVKFNKNKENEILKNNKMSFCNIYKLHPWGSEIKSGVNPKPIRIIEPSQKREPSSQSKEKSLNPLVTLNKSGKNNDNKIRSKITTFRPTPSELNLNYSNFKKNTSELKKQGSLSIRASTPNIKNSGANSREIQTNTKHKSSNSYSNIDRGHHVSKQNQSNERKTIKNLKTLTENKVSQRPSSSDGFKLMTLRNKDIIKSDNHEKNTLNTKSNRNPSFSKTYHFQETPSNFKNAKYQKKIQFFTSTGSFGKYLQLSNKISTDSNISKLQFTRKNFSLENVGLKYLNNAKFKLSNLKIEEKEIDKLNSNRSSRNRKDSLYRSSSGQGNKTPHSHVTKIIKSVEPTLRSDKIPSLRKTSSQSKQHSEYNYILNEMQTNKLKSKLQEFLKTQDKNFIQSVRHGKNLSMTNMEKIRKIKTSGHSQSYSTINNEKELKRNSNQFYVSEKTKKIFDKYAKNE